MASWFSRREPKIGHVRTLWLALCVTAIVSSAPAFANDVKVLIDQAKLVKLPEKVATIVVGNPLIADVSLQPGGVIVITGKSYGTTNLIALDRSGNVLMERWLLVEGAYENVVVVFRGVERATYSCAPDCEPRINIGDGKMFFETTITQTITRSGAALAGAALAAPR
jgi:Flp pilus assembly secretin CpaC